MAKKVHSAPSPEVSSLPIKQDESPLVIDLPDGQKLVVGHLSNGSVIEVATWRGTGRPDSRTSRLMLGMSSAAGAAEQAAAEDAQKAAAEKKSPFTPALEVLNKVLASLKSLKISTPKKSEKSNASNNTGDAPTPFIQTVSTPAPRADIDSDVDEWLNNLIKKNEAKTTKAPAKSATKASAKKTAPQTSVRKATVRKAAAKKTTGRSR